MKTRQLLRRTMLIASFLYLGILVLCVFFAEYIVPYSPNEQNLLQTWSPPSSAHILGTDGLGRDILSRLVFGSRVSIAVAIFATLFVVTIGVPLGLVSGYLTGAWDRIIMSLVDTLYAFPDVLLIIVVSAIVKTSLYQNPLFQSIKYINDFVGGILGILIALGATAWPAVCRLVRAETLSIKEREFVLASRALAGNPLWITQKHVLPNILGNITSAIVLIIPHMIIVEAGLSFLGLGVDPPTPSWGQMIAEGAQTMRSYPYMLIETTLLLSLTVLSLIIVGDSYQQNRSRV